MSERANRTVTIDGVELTVVEATRSPSGLGMAYFIAASGETDRRAALEEGESLADLTEARLGELWGQGAPLTPTEQRFEALDGEQWLAQAIGPVWGEGAAAGAVGVRTTCLTADRPVVESSGVLLSDLSVEGLASLVSPDQSATDGN